MIFGNLQQRQQSTASAAGMRLDTLASLALTCTGFRDAALDLRWSTVLDIKRLIGIWCATGVVNHNGIGYIVSPAFKTEHIGLVDRDSLATGVPERPRRGGLEQTVLLF